MNAQHIRQIIKSRGIRFIFDYAWESWLFDVAHGTDTHRRELNNQATIGTSTDSVHYVASFTSVIERSLMASKQLLGMDFPAAQFVDIGCGKGKSLVVYRLLTKNESTPPAVGIEYDERLCAIANENLKVMRLSHAAKAICDKAQNVVRHISAGKLIVYMYNPFGRSTLRQVMDRLSCIPHVLIYIDPEHKDLLWDMGYKIRSEVVGRYHADSWLVATKLL